MASKIVVLGAIGGQFREVFKKLTALHSKNAFVFAIIVGDLFADPQTSTPENETDLDALLDGTIQVPLPTYFALGNYALPAKVIEKLDSSSGELCENLSFLGKRTTIKTSEGIRLVALGGIIDPNLAVGASKDKYLPFFSEGDAKVLRGTNTADILITNIWPSGVRNGSQIAFDESKEPVAHQSLADLCVALRPRYHFSVSSEAFLEREPFINPAADSTSDAVSVTRFISLARYGNSSKQKWIYAFSLDPDASTSVEVPAGTTASPFASLSNKRANPEPASSYRFSDENNRGRHKKRQKRAPPTSAECFFCLSNPNVASHLITSIGDEVYMTTAKGPLSTSNTFDMLPFPAHMLIIPLIHAPTFASIESEESRKNTYNEMQRYRRSLNSMLANRSKNQLGSVAWEVSRAGGIHGHWQYMPLPVDLIRRKLVEVAFKVEAENEKYPSLVKRDVGDGSQESTDFFRIITWHPAEPSKDNPEGTDTHHFLPVDASFRFDLQFGRRVIAKLLGLEKRISWQDCGQTEQAEKAEAQAFKESFKDFDFALEV